MGNVSVNLGITAASGKKSTKAITDIDPNANNSDINAFVDAAMNLTTNTLTSITKIIKEDIDKTYTPLTFTVNTNPSNSSLIPTKIDDTHYTIANVDLHDTSKGVYLYKDQGGEGGDLYWALTRIDITPIVEVNSYVTVEPKNAYIWFSTEQEKSNDYSYIELSIFADANTQTSGLAGIEFNIVVPAGTNWDTYTINFKIV